MKRERKMLRQMCNHMTLLAFVYVKKHTKLKLPIETVSALDELIPRCPYLAPLHSQKMIWRLRKRPSSQSRSFLQL